LEIPKSLSICSENANAWESGMDLEVIGEIIATRQLYFVDDGDNKRIVSVFVGTPQPTPDSPGYHCPFQVIGIGSQKTQLAHGRDSIQALQSAMILIAARLNNLNSELNGKLRWDGGAGKGDLGFP
jgi:hypothetical protein